MKTLKLWVWGLLLAFIVSTQALAGAWTANEFVYKPGLGARGAEEKGRFDSGADRVDARLSKEIWVGDPKFGSTLQAAVTAIGSSQVVLRVPTGTYNIAADLTIPANIALQPERGVILSVDNTKTLTISGPVVAGDYTWITCIGTGKVVWNSPSELKSIWWGSTLTAVQQAHDALADGPGSHVINLPAGDITGSAGVLLTKTCHIRGQGGDWNASYTNGTRILYTGTGVAVDTYTSSTNPRIILENFQVNGNDTGLYGLRAGNARVIARNLLLTHFGSGGVGAGLCLDNAWSSSFHDITSRNNSRGCYILNSYNIAFHSPSFNSNLKEGLLIAPPALFGYSTFYDGDYSENGYEGIKISPSGLNKVRNIRFHTVHMELNQNDATRTDGYFQFYSTRVDLSDNEAGSCELINALFSTPTNPYNGVTGTRQVYIDSGRWHIENVRSDFSEVKPFKADGYALLSGNFTEATLAKWELATTVGLEGSIMPIYSGKVGTLTGALTETILRSFTIAKNNITGGTNITAAAVEGHTIAYVSTSSFTVTGDHTDTYPPSRWITANCGVDGIKYSSVIWSTYSSGTTLTTVKLQTAVLTSNLTAMTANEYFPPERAGLSGIKIRCVGKKTQGATHGTKTIKLYFGGTAIATIAVDDTADWRIDADLIYGTSPGYGFRTSVIVWNGSTPTYSYADVTGPTRDVNNEIKVTGTLADAADSISVTQFYVQRY